MRIKLKDDRTIEFLDESGSINTNDVMVQYFMVEFETPPTKDESLWVSFIPRNGCIRMKYYFRKSKASMFY